MHYRDEMTGAAEEAKDKSHAEKYRQVFTNAERFCKDQGSGAYLRTSVVFDFPCDGTGNLFSGTATCTTEPC
ncbi:hypothetical protein AB4Y96_05515 [Phyllobacterium sp. TAF24]|uniref:hypothetical protein n=1 Tax=Phyllobacterium sp. TAF24 TaxID=3233068 RepID=UPI003F948BB6